MFKLMTVCTGNICRSPLAQALLRRDLPSDVFSVSSSGIKAVPSAPVPPRQVELGRELGVLGLEEHVAQPTTADLLAGSDLILSMSRGHRKYVMRMDPSVARRSFTLREFARLAATVTPDDVRANLEMSVSPLHAAVEAVAQKRGLVPPPESPEDLDIVDPYKQRRAVYRRSRDELVPAAHVTAKFLNLIVELFDVEEHDTPTTTAQSEIVAHELHFPRRSDIHGQPRGDDGKVAGLPNVGALCEAR